MPAGARPALVRIRAVWKGGPFNAPTATLWRTVTYR